MRLTDLGLEGWGLIVLAPAIGSFLGVLVRRLPDERAIMWSRSRCDYCDAVLTARDLVPVISWLAMGGRCRRCGHPLCWFYPGIEVAALVVVLVALGVDDPPRAWLDSVLGWWLLALGWIDLRRWVLPDALTLPLIVAGLLASFLFEPESLIDRALGAVFGYLALQAVAAGYRAARCREGLGGGDAKLLGAAGAWVGVMALPQLILAAALAALATAGALRLGGVRLHARSALVFGPFIALPTWVLWLHGPLLH